jgi:alpha-1,2-mannosyltransferase
MLPRTLAFSLWIIVSLGSALFALRTIFREARLRATPTAVAWTAFALVCAVPTGALLNFAQISWILWGPVTCAWAWARRGRWTRAAVLLGLTMSVKPFLGLALLMLAVERRWKAALVASGTAAACLLAGIAAFGWGTFTSWVRAIGTVTWAANVFNASLFGLLERVAGARAGPYAGYAGSVSQVPAIIGVLWLTCAGIVVVVSCWAVYRVRDDEVREVDRTFAITLSAALIVSPLGWIYYHFFLAGPYLALWSDAAWRSTAGWRKGLAAGAVLCFVLPPGALVARHSAGWTASVGSAYFWGTLALWLAAMPRSPRVPS